MWCLALLLKCLNTNFLILNKNQILFFGFLFHLLAAFFSVGYHQCDELFQVFEFAGYKLGLNSAAELPWEFHEKMRSGIQPLLVFLITKAFHFFSVTNPFSISFFVRFVQSIFSFVAFVGLLKILEKEMLSDKLKKTLWICGLFFWCIPYFHARFSSENFATTLFIFGLICILNVSRTKTALLSYALAGFLFGISFLCRFQMSFMIAGFFAWLLFNQRVQLKWLMLCCTSFVLALGIGLLADKWLYGELTFSWWNYLDLNLFQDKASAFGKEPLYYYFGEALLQLIPPFSIFILVAIVLFCIKNTKHFITWMFIPFIALHVLVSHKELRFLFPALNFLPFMVLYYIQMEQTKPSRFFKLSAKKWILKTAIAVNTLLLIFYTFKPADDTSYALKKIYDLGKGKNAVLFFEEKNPYNNQASLHYFRNPNIETMPLSQGSLASKYDKSVFYFSEKFSEGDIILKNGKVFLRIYSNFPDWFKYLNFNGWLDRSFTFSIYRAL